MTLTEAQYINTKKKSIILRNRYCSFLGLKKKHYNRNESIIKISRADFQLIIMKQQSVSTLPNKCTLICFYIKSWMNAFAYSIFQRPVCSQEEQQLVV